MNDDILYYENNEVKLIDVAFQWKSFTDLYKADNTKTKKLYKAQLRYLYYIYTKSSPFSNRYTPKERETLFFSEVETDVKKTRIKSFELSECVVMIRRHGMLRSEAQLERVLEDFDKLLNHLNAIPWEREVKENIVTGRKTKEKTFMQSNMDEKMKAIKSMNDLMKLQKEVEKVMMDERKAISAGGQKSRLFELSDSMET